MNRKKKIFDKFNKKVRKAKARMNPSAKPKYVSKAEREKIALAEQAAQGQDNQTEQDAQ